MEKKILKAIEEAYRKGLKDAEGLNDIRPYLLTSQVVAHELANKFCQPLVVGRREQLPCDCGVMLKETTTQVSCPNCYKTWKIKNESNNNQQTQAMPSDPMSAPVKFRARQKNELMHG